MANRHMKRCLMWLFISKVQIKTSELSPHDSEQLSPKRTQITSAGRMWRKGNPFTQLVGMQTDVAIVSQKTETELSYDLTVPLWRIYPEN